MNHPPITTRTDEALTYLRMERVRPVYTGRWHRLLARLGLMRQP